MKASRFSLGRRVYVPMTALRQLRQTADLICRKKIPMHYRGRVATEQLVRKALSRRDNADAAQQRVPHYETDFDSHVMNVGSRLRSTRARLQLSLRMHTHSTCKAEFAE